MAGDVELEAAASTKSAQGRSGVEAESEQEQIKIFRTMQIKLAFRSNVQSQCRIFRDPHMKEAVEIPHR